MTMGAKKMHLHSHHTVVFFDTCAATTLWILKREGEGEEPLGSSFPHRHPTHPSLAT